MKTTFAKILEQSPCGQKKDSNEGWDKLISYWKPSDLSKQITIRQILESNGIKDAVWAMAAVDDQKKVMLFCADVAESVLHIFEKEHPNDDRARKCIDGVRRFAKDEITQSEFNEFKDAASSAAAASASSVSYSSFFAYLASSATSFVSSAYDSASAAAATSAASASAAYSAASAAYSAAYSDKWEEIEEILLKYI